MEYTVEFFDKSVAKFVESLSSISQGKYIRFLHLLSEYGVRLGLPHSRRLANNLYELRLRGNQGVGFFYCSSPKNKKTIVLLHGFLKKTQKIPSKELKTAFQRLDILDNKKN